MDAHQLAMLRIELIKVIDKEEDSLRIYQLGNHYKKKVEHIGIKESLGSSFDFLVRMLGEHGFIGRFAPKNTLSIVKYQYFWIDKKSK